jgi:hypothetical protein
MLDAPRWRLVMTDLEEVVIMAIWLGSNFSSSALNWIVGIACALSRLMRDDMTANTRAVYAAVARMLDNQGRSA